MATINSLPVELQSHILSYLPFQSQVFASQASKRWQALIASDRRILYAPSRVSDSLKVHRLLVDERSVLVCKVRRGRVKKFLLKYDPTDGFYRMTRSQHLEIDITDSAILDEPIYIYQRSEKKSDDGVSEPNGSAADEKATGNDGKWAGVPTFMSYMLCCQGAYHPRTVDYSDDAKWIGESGMTIRKLVERAAKVTEERIKESTKELRPTIISRNWYNIDVRYSSYPDSRIDIKAELYSNYVYTVADKKRWADSESVGFFLGVDPEDTLRYYY